MTDNKFETLCSKFSEKWQAFINFLYKKLVGLEEALSNKNNINNIIIAVICTVSFALLYFANCNTPFAADDFTYQYIFTEESTDPDYVIKRDGYYIGDKISSVQDIFTSMKAHYKVMNGRVVIHFIVQLMMLIGKPIFNFINSAVYILVLLLVYKHCIGNSNRHNSAVLFLALCLAVWTFSPDWGMTTVWMDGSINYLWGSAIRLTVLLPFRLYADGGMQKHPLLKTPLIFIGCVLAGATNENSGAAFIGMVFLFIIYYKVKKLKIPVWSVTGLIGALAGFAFMCLAPSNFKRVDQWSEAGNSLASRIVNIPANAVLNFSLFTGIFLIAALLLYTYGKKEKNYKIGIGFIYLLGAVGGALVMVASPYFPKRAWFGLILSAIIAVGNLIYQLKITPAVFRQILIIGVIFWSLWGSMSYVHMAQDAVNVMEQYNKRVDYIEEQKAAGNYDVVLSRIEAEDERSPLHLLTDLGPYTDSWQNITKSKYYGLHSITAEGKNQSNTAN